MVKSHSLRIQRVPKSLAIYLLFFVIFLCPKSWASQEAMILADRAVIYSDMEMTSPIGYISRGKKIMVGDIPRNKAQVYPVVVSGKVAYVRVIDVTTEKESMDSTRLTAERFQKSAQAVLEGKVMLGYFAFASTIDIDQKLQDDSFLWHGGTLRGEVFLKHRFDLQLMVNWMQTQTDGIKFRAFEIGGGAAFRIIDARRFVFRLNAQLMGIPYSSYAIGDAFRVNSYGFTAGGGADATIYFSDNWGVELYGGVYRTSLLEFNPPKPYKNIEPVFTGVRAGLGINYRY